MTAGQGSDSQAQEALHQLCVLYRQPIHGSLLRTGYKEHQAEDLTSGFIEHLLKKSRLEGFERTTVKFRSFLLRCLQRFVRDEWRKDTAAKRGGGLDPMDLDELELGKAVEMERCLDFEFAKAIHRQAMERLSSEKYVEGTKKQRFAALRRFVWSNDRDQGVSYEEVGKPLEMNANHVSKAVFDLRQHYYDYFRRVVSQTVAHGLIDEETRYLMTLLAESGMASEL